MFKFKLEFLLRYRRQKEETAMYELAQRIREANRVENEILTARERSGELFREADRKGREGLPAAEYGMIMDYREQLRRRGLEAQRRLVRAEKLIEKQRQVLVEAGVERKTIEKFKERQKEAYLTETARREQNQLEELAALARTRDKYDGD